MRRPVFPSAVVSWVVAVLSAAVLGSCSGGPTEPREPASNTVALRQLVAGTVIAGRSVEYQLVAPSDSTLLVSFEATSGNSADTLVATVRLAGNGAVLATIRSVGTQADLHDLMSSLAPAAGARNLTVTVAGAGAIHAGPFQLLVRPMSAEPERRAQTVLPFNTFGEMIDAPGDVDEYNLVASAGNVGWLQVIADTPFADGLRVELLDGETLLASVATFTTQDSLGQLESDYISFPRSGTFRIRVRAGYGAPSNNVGSYRVRSMEIPPAPAPIPQETFLLRPILDTLAGTDSVAAFAIAWSSTFRCAFSVELLGGAPNDTITVTFRTAVTGDSLGAIAEPAGSGPTMFLLPLAAAAGNGGVVATVHLRRRGMQARYRIRHGSPLSDAPEHVSSVIIPGQTIGGDSLTDPLDIDQYTLEAAADSEWVVSLAPTDSMKPEMYIRVYDREWRPVADWGVSGRYPEIERTATLLLLHGQGPYTFLVHGSDGYIGDYRFRVSRLDRGTEEAPAEVIAGQTFQGTIGEPGDIDDFRFNAVEGQEVYFHYRSLGATATHAFTLLDGAAIQEYVSPLPPDRLPYDQVEIKRWRAPRTGAFTVRVQNGPFAGPPENWPAPYQIEIQLVQRTPETAPPTGWVYGDTISGESLERRGDVDEFEVSFDSPVMTRLVLVAHRASSLDAVGLVVLDPDGLEIGAVGLADANGSDTTNAAAHLEFTTPGTYRFRMQSNSLSSVPFRFYLLPSYVGPESISDTLPVGVWVAGESIDSIGDVDRLYFHVDSGVTYVAEIEGMPGSTGRFYFESEVVTAVSEGLRGMGEAERTGWIQSMVVNYVSTSGPTSGPYRLRILAVRPEPETAAATLSIGDSITTESIDDYGDRDTFTFTGAAGDALRLVARSAASASGALLVAQVQYSTGVDLAMFALGAEQMDFTLPEPGTYRIVIRAFAPHLERDLGPYLLALTRR